MEDRQENNQEQLPENNNQEPQQPNNNNNQPQQQQQQQQQPEENNPQEQQQQEQPEQINQQQEQQLEEQGGRRHLWNNPGPFEQHQNRLRQIWQREHRIRAHWVQQVQRWQAHREHENDNDGVAAQGEALPELRSRHNRHSSFVRFINTLPANINVFWIDYQGIRIFYKTLAENDYLDINTFVTHPWVFVDAKTQIRYQANGEFVYLPEPWFAKYQGLNREELPPRIDRTNVYITRPMRSLRELCLSAIADRLPTDQDAYALELPLILQRELYELRHPVPENQLA